MSARIISIGTELTLGQCVDTNAPWIAQQLAGVGIACGGHVTVPDDRHAIRDAIKSSVRDAKWVVITGGLGPTPDDLTREALADALDSALHLDRASLDRIEAFFRDRNRTMPRANECQAMIPNGAVPIENTCGTAPGIRARLDGADVFLLPGVPSEMKAMFERDVRPSLHSTGDQAVIRQHVLHTFGLSEADLGQKLADLMTRGRNPTVGTSAADLVITLRINGHGATPDAADGLVETDVTEIRRRLGRHVFGDGSDTLAHAVGLLLGDQGETVAVAESCTAGLLAKRLTDVAGASAYFLEGMVVYANASKQRMLDVPGELIEAHGAVSKEVAESMAANCRRISGARYALSATGIAGPAGGSPAKPVGLVYLGLASPESVQVKELRLGATLTREQVRDRTVKIALNMLRLELLRRKE